MTNYSNGRLACAMWYQTLLTSAEKATTATTTKNVTSWFEYRNMNSITISLLFPMYPTQSIFILHISVAFFSPISIIKKFASDGKKTRFNRFSIERKINWNISNYNLVLPYFFFARSQTHKHAVQGAVESNLKNENQSIWLNRLGWADHTIAERKWIYEYVKCIGNNYFRPFWLFIERDGKCWTLSVEREISMATFVNLLIIAIRIRFNGNEWFRHYVISHSSYNCSPALITPLDNKKKNRCRCGRTDDYILLRNGYREEKKYYGPIAHFTRRNVNTHIIHWNRANICANCQCLWQIH